jgi:hypothetical protein
MISYLRTRLSSGAREATLPDLSSFSSFLRQSISLIPQDSTFALVDLFRVSLADPRVSGYFSTENDHKTAVAVLGSVNENSPYSLRLVTLQTACNLFSTRLYTPHILACPTLTNPILELVTLGLLDEEKDSIRAAASSLAFNLCTLVTDTRLEASEGHNLSENDQVALAASLIEALNREEKNTDVMKLLLSSVGLIAYGRDQTNELSDVLTALEAKAIVKKKENIAELKGLVTDVSKILSG